MKNTQQLSTKILKDVSRSFYLSFLLLPRNVRPVLSLGYLLCRAADTIADTPSTPLVEKKKLLTQLKILFGSFPVSQEKLKEFLVDLEYANLTPKLNEKILLNHFEDCALWFNQLERTDQSMLQSVVTSVISGMEMDLDIFAEGENKAPKSLKTDKELETYIHFIGGEPGRFWTNICLAHWPKFKIQHPDRFVQDGVVFGTGLQMVNILRDLPEDLKMGRCYIPIESLERHGLNIEDLVSGDKVDVFLTLYNALIDQTRFRLERGLSYIQQLPRKSIGLRAAVWWPMLIGVKTLRKLQESPSFLNKSGPIKISRSEIYLLILRSFFKLPFNSWLKREFERA